MSEPVPSAKQFEDAAFVFVVVFIGFAICAIIDGFDGVTSTRAQTYRLFDDPGGFRGALIMKWGWPAICAAIGAVVAGIGALVVKAQQRG